MVEFGIRSECCVTRTWVLVNLLRRGFDLSKPIVVRENVVLRKRYYVQI